MQEDFHYYATYCAASLAGYTPEESAEIAYSAQFVDCCTRTLLKDVHAPLSAATTQLQSELINAKTDIVGLQDITRIWSSFHFLPKDLHAEVKALSRNYRNKYRLICGQNGPLLKKTVELAKDRDLESVGLAMHVLADTWAHANFAGTPSQVINNVDFEFYEVITEEDGTVTERPVRFRHSPGVPDDPEHSCYMNSVNNGEENSIMLLGHGRAGHLPDLSFITYRYQPSWGNYSCIEKNNPEDYMHAFCQMIRAMKWLRGDLPNFETGEYDTDAVAPWKDEIHAILVKRQLNACDDWRALGERISGTALADFDISRFGKEYESAPKAQQDDTPLGRFTIAAMRQKSMVTKEIFESGNLLAGFSEDYGKKGFRGIRDFAKMVRAMEKGAK